MTFLAMIVALYSGLALVTPTVRPELLQNLFDTVQMTVSLHLAGGIIAILVGAFQVNSRLRSRFLQVFPANGHAILVSAKAHAVLGEKEAGREALAAVLEIWADADADFHLWRGIQVPDG